MALRGTLAESGAGVAFTPGTTTQIEGYSGSYSICITNTNDPNAYHLKRNFAANIQA